MNILIIDPYYEINGPHQVMIRYVEILKLKVNFYFLVPGKGSIYEDIKSKNIKVRIIPNLEISRRDLGIFGNIKLIFKNFLNFFLICKIIHKENIDIVHSTTITYFVGGIAAKLMGRKSIYHIHDLTLKDNFIFSFLVAFILKVFSDRIICVSEKARDYLPLKKLYIKKIKIIHNAVNTNIFSPKKNKFTRKKIYDKDKLIIATIGGLDYRKGQDIFVKSVEILHSLVSDKDVLFLIIGDETSSSKKTYFKVNLEKYIEERNIQSIVKLLPRIDNVEQILNKIDIIVQPSRIEAGPLVPLESMACGVPVVGTKVGAMSEEVMDGFTGFLVDPNPVSLAHGIFKLISDEDLRLEMGKNGRDLVLRKFNLEIQSETLFNYYSCLI